MNWWDRAISVMWGNDTPEYAKPADVYDEYIEGLDMAKRQRDAAFGDALTLHSQNERLRGERRVLWEMLKAQTRNSASWRHAALDGMNALLAAEARSEQWRRAWVQSSEWGARVTKNLLEKSGEVEADLTRQLESARAWAVELEQQVELGRWLHAEAVWKLEQSTKPLMEAFENGTPAVTAEPRRMADTINGKAQPWKLGLRRGQRVTGMVADSGRVITGPYHGAYWPIINGRATARIGDERDPELAEDWVVYADSLRPSPLTEQEACGLTVSGRWCTLPKDHDGFHSFSVARTRSQEMDGEGE